MIGRNLNSAVKQYVFEVLRRNPDDSVKIASERELCARFRTSRPTLRKVLAELAEEGVLLIRHGAGAFTNPMADKELHDRVDVRTIGILLGYGSSLFFDPYYWSIVDAVQHELNQHHWINMPLLQLVNDGRAAADEILKYRLDGLLWIHPDERRAEVASYVEEAGVPVISVGRSLGGPTATVMVDYAGAGHAVARYFVEEGCFSPLLAIDRKQEVYQELVDGFVAEMTALGHFWNPELWLSHRAEYDLMIERIRKKKIVFDGIFAFGSESIPCREALLRASDRDLFAELKAVIVHSTRYRFPGHPYLDINGGVLGKHAGDYLRSRLFGGEAPRQQFIRVEVIKPSESQKVF
ncbi:MAG: GntR family transcriptional regulator [Victivallaceae bacterium]